jgi:hypothetical protein
VVHDKGTLTQGSRRFCDVGVIRCVV